MSVPALMYHDVMPAGHEDASGFPGGDAARYKLTPERFAAHLDAIRARVLVPPMFTFDDGGVSAERSAAALERYGWRGYFFVTTSRINRPGFLDAATLKRLHAAGHTIGSHSHTHPLRMAQYPVARMAIEWAHSVTILSDLLGGAVRTASIPGGEYSDAVARAAAAAGIELLFTSQPTLERRDAHRVHIVGRFPILAGTRPATVAALAAGAPAARALWAARWRARAAAKFILGDAYLRLRAEWLGASRDAHWGDELTSRSKDTA